MQPRGRRSGEHAARYGERGGHVHQPDAVRPTPQCQHRPEYHLPLARFDPSPDLVPRVPARPRLRPREERPLLGRDLVEPPCLFHAAEHAGNRRAARWPSTSLWTTGMEIAISRQVVE
jgi:hypothetical protein